MVGEERIIIDGSLGEGGGQILRTAVCLSSVCGTPVEVVNIRAKRSNPGLRPQHLSAVKALSILFDAQTEGVRIGSSRIFYSPRRQTCTSLEFDIGTAGSITLLLQTIIPAVSLTGGELELKVVGGTDVKFSPTMDYFRHVVLPAYQRLGLEADLEVLRRGYYPVGGGIVKVHAKPRGIQGFLRPSAAGKGKVSVVSVCGRLPRSVAERQASAVEAYLASKWIPLESMQSSVEDSVSPGSSVVAFSVAGGELFAGGDNVGERGKPAEAVGKEAAARFVDEYEASVPVDSHLADMLVPILACTGGESVFRTSRTTTHLETNLHVSRLFTSCEYGLREVDRSTEVMIRGRDVAQKT